MLSKSTISAILILWLAAASLLLFILMGADKSRAGRKKRRIRERTLFLVALLGGGLGGALGMAAFRHKTKHASFIIGMPLLFILNVTAAVFVIWLNSRIV